MTTHSVEYEAPLPSARECPTLSFTEIGAPFLIGLVMLSAMALTSVLVALVVTCLTQATILYFVWQKRRDKTLLKLKTQDYVHMKTTLNSQYFNVREMKYSCSRTYIDICLIFSWLVLSIGRVKLKNRLRPALSAAHALVEEWEYELDQIDDPKERFIEASYMVVGAGSFTVRYGSIGRLVRSTFFKSRCPCGKKNFDCDH